MTDDTAGTSDETARLAALERYRILDTERNVSSTT